MSKQFWIVIAVIVVALIGVFTLTGKSSPASTTGASASSPTEHIEGQGKDDITLVEYGDYQCPYCGEYAATVKQVQSIYNTEIFFQFRNFPLTSIHQNAYAGARAAEAAGLMGQFWQMHDLLYTQNQQYYSSNGADPEWIGASNPETVFEQDAKSLGLNVQKFETLYASEQVNNLITADEAVDTKLNLDATPTFFLDNKAVTPANNVPAFEKIIDAEIVKKTGKPAPVTASATTATTPSATTAAPQQSKE